MKNKLIAILILITVCSCTKENMRLSNEKSQKELLMGKWYISDPNLWVYEYTPTERIRNIGNYRTKIIGLTDSTIYYEKLGSYPPYTVANYKINGDTLRMGGSGYFLKFKN
jgi:hypothetical protein